MRELEITMNDEIPRDIDFHPDFYKRMRDANEKLEKTLKPDGEESYELGVLLVIIGLIILGLFLGAISYILSKMT